MPELGKTLIGLGVLLIIVGALVWSGFGKGWFGHLPGDIHVEGKNGSFYFPVATCLLVSVVLSLLAWLFRR